MPEPQLLLTRLLLDAQEEFLAALDHVPGPGRGGPIGSLNTPAWVVSDLTNLHDAWITGFAMGAPLDPWVLDFDAEQSAAGDLLVQRPLEDARAAFVRVSDRVAEWSHDLSWDAYLEPAHIEEGLPWHGISRAYLVCRTIAHIYVHAGELSVLAALMAAGDLGLPGPLPHSTPPTAEDDPSIPTVAALLRDGFSEVRRASEITPQPAVVGAMDRLNPVSHTIAHLLGREDYLWNVRLRELPPNATLAALGASDDAHPLPWERCLAAFDEVEGSIAPWLDTITPEAGTMPLRRGETSAGAQLARSAAHFFSHAGEIMAHASLYGVEDIGMPGPLAHVRAVTSRAAAATG